MYKAWQYLQYTDTRPGTRLGTVLSLKEDDSGAGGSYAVVNEMKFQSWLCNTFILVTLTICLSSCCLAEGDNCHKSKAFFWLLQLPTLSLQKILDSHSQPLTVG